MGTCLTSRLRNIQDRQFNATVGPQFNSQNEKTCFTVTTRAIGVLNVA